MGRRHRHYIGRGKSGRGQRGALRPNFVRADRRCDRGHAYHRRFRPVRRGTLPRAGGGPRGRRADRAQRRPLGRHGAGTCAAHRRPGRPGRTAGRAARRHAHRLHGARKSRRRGRGRGAAGRAPGAAGQHAQVHKLAGQAWQRRAGGGGGLPRLRALRRDAAPDDDLRRAGREQRAAAGHVDAAAAGAAAAGRRAPRWCSRSTRTT